MDKNTELEQWFFMAGEDLKSAEYLATMHYPRPEELSVSTASNPQKSISKVSFFRRM